MNFRLSFATVCVTLILAISLVEAGTSADIRQQNQEVKRIRVVNSIRDFVRTHPNLRLVSLTKAHGKERSSAVRYTLGNRTTGDRLVAQGTEQYSYPAKKDVTVQLTYPEEGTGSVVTYVEIVCDQDSTEGNAYVVAGGIGQRFISIVIEANQTVRFSYQAQYFGA